MAIKAIIIDDELMARNLLKGMLEEYCPEVSVLDTCNDLPSGVKAIHKHKPDIVFLDIEMPGYSGLELLDFFNEDEINFSIIFVTAYNQYAVQAFKLSAVDYLLKPLEADELKKAVALYSKKNDLLNYKVLKSNLTSNGSGKIALYGVSSITFVDLDEILFFEAEGSYTKVCMMEGKSIVTSKSLKHFETILQDNKDFFRCHKSFMVNINYISEYVKSSGGYLKVKQYELSISPDKVTPLLERMGS